MWAYWQNVDLAVGEMKRIWWFEFEFDDLKGIYGELMGNFLIKCWGGDFIANILQICGENVDFSLIKFPTFSLSRNCKPAPDFAHTQFFATRDADYPIAWDVAAWKVETLGEAPKAKTVLSDWDCRIQ